MAADPPIRPGWIAADFVAFVLGIALGSLQAHTVPAVAGPRDSTFRAAAHVLLAVLALGMVARIKGAGFPSVIASFLAGGTLAYGCVLLLR